MPRRSARVVDLVVVGALAGVAAGFADGSPTEIEGFDAFLRVVMVGAVAAVAGVARRIAVTVAAVGAFVATLGGDAFAVQTAGAVAVLAMVPGWRHGRWAAVARAGSAGLALNVLLRLDWSAFQGSTALVALGVVALLVWGWVATLPTKQRHRVWLGGAVLGGVVAVAALLAGGSAMSVRGELARAVDDVQAGVDALRNVDQQQAVERFDRAAERFDRAERRLTAWWTRPGLAVPVVSQNARAVEDLVAVGEDLARTAAATAQAADPNDATLSGGAVDVEAIRALEAPLADALAALDTADSSVRTVESPWLLPQVEREVAKLRDRVAEALPDTRNALAAARVAPGLLGGDGPRTYFVAFTTPAETRGNGGFIGNYGELRLDDGNLELSRFGRIAELNPRGEESRRLTGPDDYVNRYGRFDVENFFQDVTFSPDFPSVGRVIEQLYPQATGQRLDGAISVDPVGLAALLELTGPVDIPQLDEPLTAENAAEILLRDQYLVFADDNPERIDFLETAAEAVFSRLTSGSLPGPGRIVDVLGPAVREGRLKLHSIHDEEQAFFESVGLADSWPAFSGDFVGVVSQNGSRSKIDVFLSRAVRYDAVVAPATGEVRAELEVEFRNDAPASGLPQYVIGGGVTDPGVNRMYVSIYTPLGFDRATFAGEEVLMESERELGRSVYSRYLEVPPGETRTLRVSLTGRIDALAGAPTYRLVLGRQPVIEPDEFSVSVRTTDGADVLNETLSLTEDTTLMGPMR